jgi:hypothetical protein
MFNLFKKNSPFFIENIIFYSFENILNQKNTKNKIFLLLN